MKIIFNHNTLQHLAAQIKYIEKHRGTLTRGGIQNFCKSVLLQESSYISSGFR